MKTKLLLLTAIAFTSAQTFAQTVLVRKTLPLLESFNYDEGTNLFTEGELGGQGGWQMFNVNAVAGVQNATGLVVVSQPSWDMKGLPDATNNALSFVGGSDDPVLNFTDQGSTFEIFSSFVFRIESAGSDNWTDTAGEYFFSFGKSSTSSAVNYTSNVYIKRIAGTNTFNIGIAENNTISVIVWDTNVYNMDTDIVVVTKYQIDAVNTTGLSSMWVNPTITNIEPATVLNTATKDVGVTSARTGLDKIRINKGSNAKTPNIIIDEIRVANKWWQVVGKTDPALSVAQNDIEGLKIYPNPITEGKLFITTDSNLSKKVSIYNVLGKQLLQVDNASGVVDVSTLNKGVYILKITEDGKTSTRKIIIE